MYRTTSCKRYYNRLQVLASPHGWTLDFILHRNHNITIKTLTTVNVLTS
jgi:hypothetical protein